MLILMLGLLAQLSLEKTYEEPPDLSQELFALSGERLYVSTKSKIVAWSLKTGKATSFAIQHPGYFGPIGFFRDKLYVSSIDTSRAAPDYGSDCFQVSVFDKDLNQLASKRGRYYRYYFSLRDKFFVMPSTWDEKFRTRNPYLFVAHGVVFDGEIPIPPPNTLRFGKLTQHQKELGYNDKAWWFIEFDGQILGVNGLKPSLVVFDDQRITADNDGGMKAPPSYDGKPIRLRDWQTPPDKSYMAEITKENWGDADRIIKEWTCRLSRIRGMSTNGTTIAINYQTPGGGCLKKGVQLVDAEGTDLGHRWLTEDDRTGFVVGPYQDGYLIFWVLENGPSIEVWRPKLDEN